MALGLPFDVTFGLWAYIAALVAGLVFQSILPGEIRMWLVYVVSFILGAVSNIFSNFIPFFFALGMCARAGVGRYWGCFILELSLLIMGFFVASTI